MEREPMVRISLGRYEELIEQEVRAALLAEYVQRDHNSVGAQTIAHYLGFPLKDPLRNIAGKAEGKEFGNGKCNCGEKA